MSRCAIAVVLAFLTLAAPAGAQQLEDVTGHCADVAPDPFAGAFSPPKELRILVLTDGDVSEKRVDEVVALSAAPFEEMGLRLTAVVQPVIGFSGTDVFSFLEYVKKQMGGAAPSWANAVVGLSGRLPSTGPTTATGVAECIGGLRNPESSFAVVVDQDEEPGFGPIDNTEGATSKTFSHEIGHLMAATHEMHTCEYATERPDTPCTIMRSGGGIIANHFGTVERGVIRAFANRYLKEPAPLPAPPASPAPPVARVPADLTARCASARRKSRSAKRAVQRARSRKSRTRARSRLRAARRAERRACR